MVVVGTFLEMAVHGSVVDWVLALALVVVVVERLKDVSRRSPPP